MFLYGSKLCWTQFDVARFQVWSSPSPSQSVLVTACCWSRLASFLLIPNQKVKILIAWANIVRRTGPNAELEAERMIFLKHLNISFDREDYESPFTPDLSM